jgi:1-phosphofructokinase family hexose kinase
MVDDVIIAGPNLTIDRTSTIPELRPGEVLRFEDVAVTPGGKGVNVARVARALTDRAVLVGFVPGHTGRAAAAMLADEGVELRGVPAPGELRATIVVLERSGRVTVINEPGPRVGRDDWERFRSAVDDEMPSHRVLACSGSVPPGAPDDAYAQLAALAGERGAFAIVDAGGALLAEAVAAGADLVGPNLAEAEGMLGRGADEAVEHSDPVAARRRAAAAAAELMARGAGAAIVTAGSAGAAFSAGGETWWHPAPSVVVRNPIGAGDSVVGGIAVALERGEALGAAVRFGLAAGAASVETSKAGEIQPSRVEELRSAAPAAERIQ